MGELTRKEEILMFIYKGQREESLQHRRTILNTFVLSMTGLMVILGGVISGSPILFKLRVGIAFVVGLLCAFIFSFMMLQRHESEKAMNIMRRVEKELKLNEEGIYLPNEPVLPSDYSKKQTSWGLTKGDWFQAWALIIFGLFIIVIMLWLLPNCS